MRLFVYLLSLIVLALAYGSWATLMFEELAVGAPALIVGGLFLGLTYGLLFEKVWPAHDR